MILVDHGSRRAESNAMLGRVAELFVGQLDAATSQDLNGSTIVEAAHMELSEPTIEQAFARCVQRGAERIVVFPYFLFPGRHWDQDIPRLAGEAAARFPDVTYLVAAPLGLHPLLTTVVAQRIEHCLQHAQGNVDPCEVCAGDGRCQFRTAGE